jgi:hypothetical protein
MNLEEIRSRNSTVHALEALHLCRFLHVSSFSEKYGHGMFVVPHVLSSSSSILYLHLYHSLYPKYVIYKLMIIQYLPIIMTSLRVQYILLKKFVLPCMTSKSIL